MAQTAFGNKIKRLFLQKKLCNILAMKQCPQCRQTYPDDTLFCLSDGTPLSFINNAPEEVTVFQPTQPTQEQITVVKPHREEITVVRSTENIQPFVPPAQKGVSPIFAYLSIGLLLLLVGGVVIGLGIFVVSRMSGSNKNTEITKLTNTDNGQNKMDEQQANLRQQQEQIEKERQRLANERQKLIDEKKKPPIANTSTPVPTPMIISTPPTSPTPPPAVNYPPQPTAGAFRNQFREKFILSAVLCWKPAADNIFRQASAAETASPFPVAGQARDFTPILEIIG
jgi:hypothetical protein